VQTLQTVIRFAPETRTDIHKFAVSGSTIDYRGSGNVDGHLGWDREKAPYRLSEHNGTCACSASPAAWAGWYRPTPPRWRVAGHADDLARAHERPQPANRGHAAQRAAPAPIGKPGEQVYAVRFLGDRAYVVTFRQTDPLYVLDLSNPADPRAAGELQIPGFSDYLFRSATGCCSASARTPTSKAARRA